MTLFDSKKKKAKAKPKYDKRSRAELKARFKHLASSMRFKMVAVYLSVTIIALIVVLIVISETMGASLLSTRVTQKQNELSKIAVSISKYFIDYDFEGLYKSINSFASEIDSRIIVLDSNFIVLSDSASLYNGYYLPYEEAVRVIGHSETQAVGYHEVTNTVKNHLEWVAYLAQPLTHGGEYIGAVVCATPIQDAYDSVSKVQQRILGVFFLVGFCIAISCWIFTGMLTRPLVKLTDIISKNTVKHFSTHVDIKCSGEVAELVNAYNSMSTELVAYDKVRDRFVADASHELKTPLASIKVLSESLISMGTPDPALMMEFFSDINTEVDRLNKIVVTLLEIARESSDNAKLDIKKLDLSELAGKVCIRLRPISESRSIKLLFEADGDITILADEMRMDRIITNLVDNAIKYTEKGSVSVSVTKDRNNAFLTITDTGVGIPEDALIHLFDRFYRVDKARSRATGGTGLGLSLVHDLVEKHGGTISVKSTVGEGSVFTVTIPLAK